MSTLPIDKWIHGVLPGDPVSIAAKRSLHAWLAAVQHYLPLATHHYEDDSDYVLKLRVWSRRAAVALKLYAELLPAKEARALKKQMRALRKAVSEARDCDILIARLAGSTDPKNQALIKKVRKKRKRAQKPLAALYRRYSKKDKFNCRIALLLEGVHSPEEGVPVSDDPRFDEWAREKLRPMAEKFLAMASTGSMDVEALHELRLKTKDLRYTMELLGGAFSPDFSVKLYPLIEAMQDKLGEINDLVVELAYMKQQLAETDNLASARHIRARLSGKQSHLSYLIHEFHHWLSPQLFNTLRLNFEECLGNDYSLELIHA
jgi:CHAD domain-containing protein